MMFKQISHPTVPISEYVETRQSFKTHFGSFSQRLSVKDAIVSKQLGIKDIGLSVNASLNFAELNFTLQALKKFIPQKFVVGINLGSVNMQEGGGKTYESEATTYRYRYKDKLDLVLNIASTRTSEYGIKLQQNYIGPGWHGLPQTEFIKRSEILGIPYRINYFGYPTDERSEKNFPELLSYWYRQSSYRNIIYNNPTGDVRVDVADVILSKVITNRQQFAYDRTDLSDMFSDLAQNKFWLLTAYVSGDPRFTHKWDVLKIWRKPQVDRQDKVLQNLVMKAKPGPDDICLIAGDFGDESIRNLQSFTNSTFKFKPRIRQMLCKILPDGMNAIFGVLRKYDFKPVDTPHFDHLEFLMESDP